MDIEMKYKVLKTNYVNGYKVLNIPEYPTHTYCGSYGWVYEHIFLMEHELGRQLKDDEHVHHLDGNRGNNRLENLVVLSQAHHLRIHKWMERSKLDLAPYKKADSCGICGLTLQHKQLKYCSTVCELIVRRSKSNKPSKDELLELTQRLPFTKIGKLFGVSDNAIRKWCKSYDIPTNKQTRGRS